VKSSPPLPSGSETGEAMASQLCVPCEFLTLKVVLATWRAVISQQLSSPQGGAAAPIDSEKECVLLRGLVKAQTDTIASLTSQLEAVFAGYWQGYAVDSLPMGNDFSSQVLDDLALRFGVMEAQIKASAGKILVPCSDSTESKLAKLASEIQAMHGKADKLSSCLL